jgi:hypothetical protein
MVILQPIKITEQLKNIVVTRFTDAIGEAKIPVLDMASNYDEISKSLKIKLNRIHGIWY